MNFIVLEKNKMPKIVKGGAIRFNQLENPNNPLEYCPSDYPLENYQKQHWLPLTKLKGLQEDLPVIDDENMAKLYGTQRPWTGLTIDILRNLQLFMSYLVCPTGKNIQNYITLESDLDNNCIIHGFVSISCTIQNKNEEIAWKRAIKHHKTSGKFCRLPIFDYSAGDKTIMETIILVILKSINNGKNIAIHCSAGYGRTGSVMLTLLTYIYLKHYKKKYEQENPGSDFLSRLEDYRSEPSDITEIKKKIMIRYKEYYSEKSLEELIKKPELLNSRKRIAHIVSVNILKKEERYNNNINDIPIDPKYQNSCIQFKHDDDLQPNDLYFHTVKNEPIPIPLSTENISSDSDSSYFPSPDYDGWDYKPFSFS